MAAGANSAVPHHRPTEAVLESGISSRSTSALVGGYHSDMTRTFVLGNASGWQREIYDIVAAAQRTGLAALEVGVALRDIDAAARRVIADTGYGDHFGHGLRPRVGLQIHEAPGSTPRPPVHYVRVPW